MITLDDVLHQQHSAFLPIGPKCGDNDLGEQSLFENN
jgi:hypothetical protein